MKNIFTKISIIFIMLILSISAISLADNETNSQEVPNYDDQVVPISMEGGSPVDVSVDNKEYTTYKNYFYAGMDDVNITDPVQGDVFIATSGSVTIDATIGGNAFICASSVTITSNSAVQASLFNASNSLNIAGAVGINVYSVSNEFILNGTIENDLFESSSKFNLNGYVYGDANVSAESISISDKSYIENDLNYASKEQANIPENVVHGQSNYSAITDDTEDSFALKDYIISVISFVIFALVIFAISKWLNCKFINTYPDFVKNLPKSLVYGLLALITIPVVCVILLVCGVTISLAFILMALYFVLMLISSSAFIIILAKFIAEKLQVKFNKCSNMLLTISSIIILCIVYKLLKLIPTFGIIVTFIFVLVGSGILVKNIFPTKEIKKS